MSEAGSTHFINLDIYLIYIIYKLIVGHVGRSCNRNDMTGSVNFSVQSNSNDEKNHAGFIINFLVRFPRSQSIFSAVEIC